MCSRNSLSPSKHILYEITGSVAAVIRFHLQANPPTMRKLAIFCQNLKMTFQWSEKTDLSNITIFISRLKVRKITQQPSNITLWREQAWMEKSQEPEQQTSSSLRQLLIHVVATPVIVSTRLDFGTSFRLIIIIIIMGGEVGASTSPVLQRHALLLVNPFRGVDL